MDDHIIKQIQIGNNKIFEELFKSHYPDLCKFAYHYVKQYDIAEDLVQNVFLSIWENHQRWRPKGTIKSYLFLAVRNQAINIIKRNKVEQKWISINNNINSQFEPSAESQWHERELLYMLEKEIDKLPKRCRSVFVLNRIVGLKYSEIGEVLGISKKTIETQMGRAIKKLDKILRNVR